MNRFRSILILFIAAIVWGFAFVAQRVGGSSMGSFAFNAFRFLLGALSLVPVIILFEKKDTSLDIHATRKAGIICGLIIFLASSFQQMGVVLTDYAGKSGFITDFYIILVPLIGMFFHKKVSKQAWIGALIALIGFYFLCMRGSFTLMLGDILLFICAIFFAFHILTIDYFSNRVYPLRLSFYQFITCSFLSFIGMFLFEEVHLYQIQEALIPILYGGLMSVGVGYTLQTIGQKGCDSTTSAIILSSESVFCVIGSWLLLHEMMDLQSYIGCLLVFLGIILAQLPDKKMTQASSTFLK